jgi:hypothetical protein
MGMAGAESELGIADNYRRFAEHEAAGRSPAYERLALAVADDELILGFLDGLPRGKRQPNLMFAAARLVLGETIERLSALVASVRTNPRPPCGLGGLGRMRPQDVRRCRPHLRRFPARSP